MNTQKEPDNFAITGVTRRNYLRAGAVTGAAVTGVGAGSASVTANGHIAPWEGYSVTESIKDTLVATSPAAYGIDYLMGTDYTDEAQKNIANYLHRRYGDMSDYSEYTGGDALFNDIHIGATEMKLATEKVFTSINNHIEASDNVALSKGKVALAESLNNGDDVSTAKSKMNTVLNEYYAKIQENVLNHYNTQASQAQHYYAELDAHGETDVGSIIYTIQDRHAGEGEDGYEDPIDDTSASPLSAQSFLSQTDVNESAGDGHYQIQAIELLDGRTIECPCGFNTDSNGNLNSYVAPTKDIVMNHPSFPLKSDTWGGDVPMSERYMHLVISPDKSGSPPDGFIHFFDSMKFINADLTIKSSRDRVNANLQGFADDIYSTYEPGEVDLTNVLDPITYATELSQNNNQRAFRKAAAAQMGMPTAAESNIIATIHFEEGDEDVWIDLFTDHVPEDSEGNPVGFQVGETYDPNSWSEPLFIVFEDEAGEAEMSQLETSFTISKAYDDEGNEVTNFSTESTNTQTSDVAQLQADLDKLRQTQLEMLEQWEEPVDDSGGTGGTSEPAGSWFDDLSNRTLAIVGGVLIGLAALARGGGGDRK